jgi:serine protease Do
MALLMRPGLATVLHVRLSAELAALAERVQESVVLIRSGRNGSGSGVIWRSDGLIVTNDHVAPFERAEVVLAGGTRLQGRVVARDRALDLAALQTGATGLPAATLGDSRRLRVGELVLAVGNPLGSRGAASLGIVSGTGPLLWGNRRIGWEQREYIEADVELLPGNSGGALVDARGRVIGIPTMVTGMGLALAVPSHVVTRFLAGEGADRRPLGIETRWVELPPVLAQQCPAGTRAGLLVVEVKPNSPAERAGLLTGDILVCGNRRALGCAEELQAILAAAPEGGVELLVLRGGKLHTLHVPRG